MKKLLSLMLALCLCALMLLPAVAAATETDAVATPGDAETELVDGAVPETAEKTFTSVADVAKFILEPSPWGEIQITPATLQTEEGAQDVYLVALRGTGFSMNKSNNVIACFLSAFDMTSNFYRITRDAVFKYVPEGSRILFAGHSLGGMIEQQLTSRKEFTDKYEVLNTLTMGSPYVLTRSSSREGTLVRCVDSYDVIPLLGPGAVLGAGKGKVHRLDGGYLGDPNSAHNLSYMRKDLWGGYDVLGVKDGSAKLVFQAADVITLSA